MDYLDDAKREETKINRMEKIKTLILSKTGLNDKYKQLHSKGNSLRSER